MDARSSAIDCYFHSASILRRRTKGPTKSIRISSDIFELPEFVLLPLMPEQRFAKDQPEGHFVHQCLQCSRTCVGAGEMRMCPSPEVAMPVSAVVSLNSES